ncbi:hypothetical protein EAO75_37320 [Streptomyces sp. uw30]|uniref:DUF4344 domain-containing metallopeptidase n=1 Tax=Streptomyces sp. uw30 TaxID=1828179 RepID=UPI0011CEB133|nr:DUF4344 domain-containing metallopeptidase [Streptomyces sp. uw30]TXS40604.1 hypothetical protein EAO75_37320 [Streptomyces sp. uw30]
MPRKSWVAAALTVLAVTVSTTSCATGPDPAAGRARAVPAAHQPAPRQTSPEATGTGVLVPGYLQAATQQDSTEQNLLQQNEVMESVAAYANSLIALPQDVAVNAESCEEPNAWWDKEQQSITLCYGYLGVYRGLFQQQNTSGTQAQQTRATDDDLIGFSNSVVLHELGHALIDLYKLPVTGKEEDAADQLAALLLSLDTLHQEYAASAIQAWEAAWAAAEQGVTLDELADEHALSAQRYYNAICWLYGSDPTAYQGVVQSEDNPEAPLPAARAARCPDEFKQLAESWTTLLGPYLKTGTSTSP